MNETALYVQAFAVYLAKTPDKPDEAAALAKAATRAAMAEWNKEEKPAQKPA